MPSHWNGCSSSELARRALRRTRAPRLLPAITQVIMPGRAVRALRRRTVGDEGAPDAGALLAGAT